MKQQLYINGVAVDMPADTIKIKVASNIMSDISKVMTAHSYSINLPRTANNDKIFSLAYVVGANTGGKSTHTYLKASLFMDDVPLFEDGQAVLNKVDNSGYNINLYWGLLNVFDLIKNEGLNVCDMPMSSRWNESTMANWIELVQYDDQLPHYKSGMTSAIYDTLDDESKERANYYPWLMPSVSAMTILNKIAEVYGFSFSFSAYAYSRINLLWHPLVTRRITAKDEELSFVVKADYLPPRDLGTGASRFIATNTTLESISNNYICYSATHNDSAFSPNPLLGYNKVHIKRIHVEVVCNREFIVKIGSEITLNSTYSNDDGLWHIDESRYDISTDDEKQIVSFEPKEYSASYGWNTGDHVILGGGAEVVLDDVGDTATNYNVIALPSQHRRWCYERNYPDIGIINYISEVLAHIGGCMVGSVTKPNSIKITTYDEIIGNTYQIFDTQGVSAITMTLDNLAQKNIYKHKAYTDDESDWEAEGVIYTADTTLALEAVAFESKFKVPRSGLIRLWTIEDSDEEGKQKATWTAEGDYICANVDGYLYNLNEDFVSTLEDYYSKYEKIVERPKVVDAVVRMDFFDLRDFDFTRPIYIKQLSSAFVIIELNSEDKNQYTLKLVKI